MPIFHRHLLWFLLVFSTLRVDLALAAADGNLAPAVKAAAVQHGFTADQIGYVLLDLDSGKTVDHWQADKAFVPGSVLKLATSLAAWHNLGPEFHFVTQLWRKGRALYLQGSGDPVLTATDLRMLVQSLQRSEPAGGWQQFYVDASAILPAMEISAHQPVAADYNPGFGALNVNFNRVALDWHAGGSTPAYRLISHADDLDVPTGWLSLLPIVTDLPAGAPFILAHPGDERQPESWFYDTDLNRAGLTSAGSLFLPVKQADATAARIFRALAVQQGIDLPIPQNAKVPADATLIVSHDSPALPDLLKGLLRYSNNLTAELVGLRMATRLGGHAMTLPEAAQQQMQWLRTYVRDSDWQSFRMVNHSGLDGDNRATPRQITAILRAISAEPDLANCLPDLHLPDLPLSSTVSSQEGVRGRGVKISGKSGTMDYAAGLAGLMTTHDGHRFAYAIFIADDRRRLALAATFDPRVLRPAKDGRNWTDRAHQLEDDLLAYWLTRIAK